jgi:hypothetical protein
VIQPDIQRFSTAHREACDCALLAVLADVVGLVHYRHDFLEQDLRVAGEILRSAAACGSLRGAVTERRNNDHRYGLVLGDQVVEDVRGTTASRQPSFGVVTEAVQEIQHWVRLWTTRLVAGRRVDKEIPIVVGNCRVVGVACDGASRHTGRRQPWLRTRHDQHALEAPKRCLHLTIGRIVDRGVVNGE